MIDLDNTLGNRSTAVEAWIAAFVRERKLPAEAMSWFLDADNDGYRNRNEVFAEMRAMFDLDESAESLVANYRTNVVKHAAATPGAVECLHELRSLGWSLAIVTNGSSTAQHAKVDAIGFRQLVDAVIVSEDLSIKKPDRRIFEAAAEATGQTLEGSWMVGDSALHDIVGASALGSKTAWVHRGRSWPVEHPRPTVELDDLTQLVDKVTSHS